MPELRVHRSPWRDFPDVIIQTNMTKLKGHPAYRAAKEGDLDAALQVVESVCKPSKIPWAVDEIVAVAQIDRDKKNALPIAYALQLGDEMGVPVNNTVVQENIVSHTGADAPTRVLGQPIFNGTIGERKCILIIETDKTEATVKAQFSASPMFPRCFFTSSSNHKSRGK
jgi:hypothetical protein